MKRLANFLVEKRKTVLIIFLLLTVVSIWLITLVPINTDMTKYLPEDSPMKKGLAIMSEEFPPSSSFYLMVQGLPEAEKTKVQDDLLTMNYVQGVSYEPGSEKYNVDDKTLYVIQVDAEAASPQVKSLVASIRAAYSGYTLTLSGDALGNTAVEIIPKLAAVAVVILMVILCIMCNSWMEPLLFLATIAIAVLINMGTNIILGSVSDITSAIAAVLQLVLSMDYSIMLLNRYRQEKTLTQDNNEAMKKALCNAFVSISSSSITTIVGMLALVFMSFTIGRDMGLVLAKGVLLSLVCIFTVLPALILMSDRLIEKTAKKSPHINMNAIATYNYRGRVAILIAFVVLFGVSYQLRGNVEISYSLTEFYEINRTFYPDNQIVTIYENEDEDAVAAIATRLEADPNVESVNTYATTLGKPMTYGELADATDMDGDLAALVYYNYFDARGNAPAFTITLEELIRFVKEDVSQDEQLQSLFTPEDLAMLEAFDGDAQLRLTAEDFAEFSGVDPTMVQLMYNFYFAQNGQSDTGDIALDDLLAFMVQMLEAYPQFAQMVTPEQLEQLNALVDGAGDGGGIMQQPMTAPELSEYLDIDEDIAKQLLYYHAISQGEMPQGSIPLYDFMMYLLDDLANDEQFAPYLTGDVLAQLADARVEMDKGIAQLRGPKHSRMIIATSLPEESEETFAFVENLEQDLGDSLAGSYYLVGNTPMAYEMDQTFPAEMDWITLLTAIAIFVVVAIAFRSLSIPLILVCIIQCAIFITMGSIYLQGNSIYYLPLLIVQCLLMGATVDYGILYTSYYREARATLGVQESVASALNNSIHTILTSALILILVTSILGLMLAGTEYAISEILLIIARGGLCSTLLVVFVLPGVMATLDRFVCRTGKKKT